MSRRRLNRPGVSGVFTFTSARRRRCAKRMRWPKKNDGAPGIDGVTFEAIETQGADALLEQIRDELIERTYKPLPARRQAIPKDGGKVRVLSIPAIRDRVAQGALKLILEPIFGAPGKLARSNR